MKSSLEARFLRSFLSISQTRLVLLMLVCVVRAAMASLLGSCGALWLCRTRDIENIVQPPAISSHFQFIFN